MPIRHGNTYRAFGWLVAVCLYLGPALAQQDVEKPTATVDEGQGVAGEAPPQEEDGGKGAEGEKPPPADPLPAPLPVETEISAEPACGPRCEAAQQREKEDLVAQQRMADSTRDVVVVTEWQLYVGGVGIALLVLTLVLTVRATNAAVEANRIARKSAERQLRAYVGLKDARITMNDEGELSYRVRYKNYGQTPGFKLTVQTSCTATPLPLKVPLSSTEPEPDDLKSMGILWPTQFVENTRTMFAPGTQLPGKFTPEYRDDIAAARAAVFLYGEIAYWDIFKKRRSTTFRLMYTGPWGGHQSLDICEEGNEAT